MSGDHLPGAVPGAKAPHQAFGGDAVWDWDAATEQAAEPRTVVLVSADVELRKSLRERLEGQRWHVREAGGGAQAMVHLEAGSAEAMLLDHWLPDLEVREFAAHVSLLFPQVDLIQIDPMAIGGGGEDRQPGLEEKDRLSPSPRRNELLHAIRQAKERVPDALEVPNGGLQPGPHEGPSGWFERGPEAYRVSQDGSVTDGSVTDGSVRDGSVTDSSPRSQSPGDRSFAQTQRWIDQAGDPSLLPELVGASEAMREVARLVRLVAPRSTTVLIEGETGTGKEVVARALHRLSARADKPFTVLNCAAVPEALLEAELFGHTRGAFSGAVQARIGRIEAANGGTLFLDEIGEMPVRMQAKMLRFLESGELQRVGDNQTAQADVRLIAATNQPLEQRLAEGVFRLDLYHRLAVFPIELPPLRERMEDIPALAEHFLQTMGQGAPRKRLAAGALARLQEHAWPGNVRELMHVLERGAILAGANPEIAAEDIRYRRTQRS